MSEQIELAYTIKRLEAVMKLAEKLTNETPVDIIERVADIIMNLTNKINILTNELK